MKSKTRTTALVSMVTLALSGAIYAAGDAGIQYKAPTAYPEGVAHNAKTGDFYVSSMRHGTVGIVKADGSYKAFAKDPLLISSVGMHADPDRNRLLVCVSDPGVSEKTSPKTQKKIARLVSFDLKTGKKLKSVDLDKLAPAGGEHFCNDTAIDDQGNAYVTDSFSPIIYKVDPSFKASVFATNDLFKGKGFGLNGIVHHKDGYLLVVKMDDGTLLKVDEKDPTKITVVAAEKVPNGDGLVLLGDSLDVIQNGETHKVTKLKSTDGWKTAKVEKTFPLAAEFPTTGVDVGGKLYVNMSHLNELFADPKKATTDSFTLAEIAQ
jgi:sugar lactone lactonase YvrE